MGKSETNRIESDQRGNLLAIGAVALVVLLVVASTAIVTTNSPEGGSAPEPDTATDLVESGIENELERGSGATANEPIRNNASVNVTTSEGRTQSSPGARRAVEQALGDRISNSTRHEVAGLLSSLATKQRQSGAVTDIQPTDAGVEFGLKVELGESPRGSTAISNGKRIAVLRTVEQQPRTYTTIAQDRPGSEWEQMERTGTEDVVLERTIAEDHPGEDWDRVRVISRENATYEVMTNATQPGPGWKQIGINGTTSIITETVVGTEAPGDDWKRLETYSEQDDVVRTQINTTRPGPEWEFVENVSNGSVVRNETIAANPPDDDWERTAVRNESETIYKYVLRESVTQKRWRLTLKEGGTLAKYGKPNTVALYDWRKQIYPAQTVAEYERTEQRAVYKWRKNTTETVTGLEEVEIAAAEMADSDGPRALLKNATGTRNSTITFSTDTLPIGSANATTVTVVPNESDPAGESTHHWTMEIYRATNGTAIAEVEGETIRNDGATTRVNLDQMAINGTSIPAPAPEEVSTTPMDIYLTNASTVYGSYSLFATNDADSEMAAVDNVTVEREIQSATFDVTYQDERTTYTDTVVVKPDYDPLGNIVVERSTDPDPDESPEADFTLTEQNKNYSHVTYGIDASPTTADSLLTTYDWAATDHTNRVTGMSDGQISQTITVERADSEYYLPLELRVVDEIGLEDTTQNGTVVPAKTEPPVDADFSMTVTEMTPYNVTVEVAAPEQQGDSARYSYTWDVVNLDGEDLSRYPFRYVVDNRPLMDAYDRIGAAPRTSSTMEITMRRTDSDYTLGQKLTVRNYSSNAKAVGVEQTTIPAMPPGTNRPPEAGLSIQKLNGGEPELSGGEVVQKYKATASTLSEDPDGTIQDYDFTLDRRTPGGRQAEITYEVSSFVHFEVPVRDSSQRAYDVGMIVEVTDDDGATDTARARDSVPADRYGRFHNVDIQQTSKNRTHATYKVEAGSSNKWSLRDTTFAWEASGPGGVTGLSNRYQKNTQTFTAERLDDDWEVVVDSEKRSPGQNSKGQAVATVPGTGGNIKPYANAEATQVDKDPYSATYKIDASGSYDTDGTITQYEWSSPNRYVPKRPYRISDLRNFDPSEPVQRVTLDRDARDRTAQLQVTVTDDDGESSRSETIYLTARSNGEEPDEKKLGVSLSEVSRSDTEVTYKATADKGGGISWSASGSGSVSGLDSGYGRDTETFTAERLDSDWKLTVTGDRPNQQDEKSGSDSVTVPAKGDDENPGCQVGCDDGNDDDNDDGGGIDPVPGVTADLTATVDEKHDNGTATIKLDTSGTEASFSSIEGYSYSTDAQTGSLKDQPADEGGTQTVLAKASGGEIDMTFTVTVENNESDSDTASDSVSTSVTMPDVTADLTASIVDTHDNGTVTIELDASDSSATGGEISDYVYPPPNAQTGSLEDQPANKGGTQRVLADTDNGDLNIEFTLTVVDPYGSRDTTTHTTTKTGDGVAPTADLDAMLVEYRGDEAVFEIDASDSTGPIDQRSYTVLGDESAGSVKSTLTSDETQEVTVALAKDDPDAKIQLSVENEAGSDTDTVELSADPLSAQLDASVSEYGEGSVRVQLDATGSQPSGSISVERYTAEMEAGSVQGYIRSNLRPEAVLIDANEEGRVKGTFTVQISHDEADATDTATDSIDTEVEVETNQPPEADLDSQDINQDGATVTFELDASDSSDSDDSLTQIEYTVIEENGEVLDTITDGEKVQTVDVRVVDSDKPDAVVEVTVSDGQEYDTATTELQARPGQTGDPPEIRDVEVPSDPNVDESVILEAITTTEQDVTVLVDGQKLNDKITTGRDLVNRYFGETVKRGTMAHSFNSAGEHTVKFVATNQAGSDSMQKTVDVNQEPQITGTRQTNFGTWILTWERKVNGNHPTRHGGKVDISASDPDNDDVTISISNNDPTDVCYGSTNGDCTSNTIQGEGSIEALVPTGGSASSKQVTITATDEHGASTTESLTLGPPLEDQLDIDVAPMGSSPGSNSEVDLTNGESVSATYGIDVEWDGSSESFMSMSARSSVEVYGPDGTKLYDNEDRDQKMDKKIRFDETNDPFGDVSKPGTYTVRASYTLNGRETYTATAGLVFDINRVSVSEPDNGQDDQNSDQDEKQDRTDNTDDTISNGPQYAFNYPGPSDMWIKTGKTKEVVKDTVTDSSYNSSRDANGWESKSTDPVTKWYAPTDSDVSNFDKVEGTERVKRTTTNWFPAWDKPQSAQGKDVERIDSGTGAVKYEITYYEYKYETNSYKYTWVKKGTKHRYKPDPDGS